MKKKRLKPTIIRVTLPGLLGIQIVPLVKDMVKPSMPMRKRRTPGPPKARVLIAVGEADLAASLAGIVNRQGYVPLGPATNAAQVAALARAEQPDVILLHLHLEGAANGLEIADQIRQHQDIPIVYLISEGEEPLLQEAARTEPYSWMTLPPTPAGVQLSIETALYKQRTEQNLRHLNQILRVIGDIHQIINHEKNAERLLEKACQILLQTRGYVLAWVGLKDETGKRLKVIARAGKASDYLDKVVITWDDSPTGKGPTGSALRSLQPVVCRDIANDPYFAPWRKEALARGFACFAAIPMLYGGEVLGALNVYGDRLGLLDDEEVTLLQEVANDLAFALVNLQREAEHQKLHEALRASEARYQAFFNAATEMAFIKDDRFRYLMVNEAYRRFLGKPLAEILGKDDFALLETHVARVCRQSDRRALQQQSLVVTIEPIGNRLYETRKFPVALPDGRIGVGAYIREITEQKRAEEAIKASEQRFRTLTQKTSAAILIYQGSKIRYANPICERITGYSAEELARMDFWELAHPDFRDLVRQRGLARQRGEAVPDHYPIKIVTKSGEERWVDFSAGRIEYEGQPAAIGTAFDITALKKAEEELAASAQRFQWLYEYAPIPYHILTPQGLIQDVNRRWCEVLGYSREEVLGKSIFDFIAEDEREAALASFERKKQSGQPFVEGSERTFCTKAGEHRIFKIYDFFVLDEAQRLVAVQTTIEDITERKRAEQALRESRQTLQLVLDTIPVRVFWKDRDSKYLGCNHPFARDAGLSAPEEVIGKNDFELAWKEQAERYRADDRAVIKSGLPKLNYEEPQTTPDGRTIWLRTSKVPLVDAEGNIRGVLGTYEDITERKRAEEALQRHLAELEVLYEAGLTLSRLLEPKQIAQRLLDVLSQRLAWHHAAIRLYNAKQDRLELLALSQPGLAAKALSREIKRLSRLVNRPEQGLSGWAFQHGRALRLANVQADKRYVASFAGMRSGLYVPIRLGKQTTGVIAIESEQENAFSETDERLLTTLAAQAAIAFENARLYQDAVRAAKRRAVLHRAGQEISAAGLDLEAIYAATQRAVAQLMPAETFTIVLYDRTHQVIDAVYLWEGGKRYPSMRIPFGQGISSLVIRQRESLRLQDYRKERPVELVHFGSGREPRSMLVVPMLVGETVVGAISVQSYTPNLYSEEDEHLLEMLAAYAGAAIENARLYQAERRQRELAESLRDTLGAGASLSRALDTEAVLDELLDTLHQVVPYDTACVMTVDEEKRTATIIRSRGYEKYGKAELIARLTFDLDATPNLRWMLEHRTPRVIEDVRAFPGWIDLEASAHIRSWAGAPILIDDKVVAFFSVDSDQVGFYTAEHVELLKAFAGQAALALQNARRVTQIRRRAKELETLYEVSLALSQATQLETVGQQTMQALQRLLRWQNATIFLIDESGERLSLFAHNTLGLDKKTLQAELTRLRALAPSLGEGIVGWAAQYGQTVRCGDVRADPRYRQVFPETRSELCVPLKVGSRTLGVINVESPEWNAFGVEEERLLTSLAGLVAAVIERIRLLEETQRRADELAALMRLSQALRAARNRTEMFPIVLEHLTHAFPASGAVIALTDFEHQELVIEAASGVAEKIRGVRLSLTMPGLADILREGQPYLNNKPPQTALAFLPGALQDIPAIAAVPLVAQGFIIGLAAIASSREITPRDMRLLNSLADIAASAIQRAALNEQTERHVQRLTALRAIDLAISTVTDQRALLDILLSHMQAQLGVDAVAVLTLDETDQTLTYRASLGFYRPPSETRLRAGEGVGGRVLIEHRSLSCLTRPDIPLPHLADEAFVFYHGVPLISKGRLRGVVEFYHRSPFTPNREWTDFAETLASQTAIALDNIKMYVGLQRAALELEAAYDATIEGWSKALDLREHETERHSYRVTEMTLALARRLGIGEADLVHIRRGALLHDMGKIAIPDPILLKPGPLTEEEWKIMHSHPQTVYDMLAPISYLRLALDIPLFHHERWDGSGYPYGLKGEQIPLSARIFAVVDVFDALISDRPYRKAWPRAEAIAYLREQSGKQFDPHVVREFLRMIGAEESPAGE